jgi:peptidoglycan hydrolase-like protein with peptidoglycan-binding domain
MNKNVILSGIAVTVFLTSGCGRQEQDASTPFESEEMAEDMNSTLNNEIAMMSQGTDEMGQAEPEAAAVFDPSQPYVTPTNEEIQQSLKNAGFYEGKVDGVVGPRTKKAIRDFQAQNSLNSDGRIGPQTWARLAPFLHQTQDATVAPADAIGN